MRALCRLLLLCLAMALPQAALAQDDLRLGTQAFQRGDYETARQHLEKVALDPRAAYLLGHMKANGRGGPVDHETAVRHYREAALQGHVGAMTSLGFMFDNGWGVARNGAQAQELYVMGAAAGIAMARNNLAYLWARQNGLLEQALCLSAETLAVEPDNAFFLDTYGFILLQMNQAARAEAYFRKAIGIAPDYADALEHLGDVAAMTGKGDAANYWRRAASNPRDDRQAARVAAKLAGAPLPGDINAHPPFALRGEGLPRECGVPSV